MNRATKALFGNVCKIGMHQRLASGENKTQLGRNVIFPGVIREIIDDFKPAFSAELGAATLRLATANS